MSLLKVLFVADICGKVGRQAASHIIKRLREEKSIDYVIANVENAAGGFGVTPEMSKKIFSYGVDFQTSGNHIWDRYEIINYLKNDPKLLRPGNYPKGVPGKGMAVDVVGNYRIAVMNLMGRVYMKELDCPFMAAERMVELARNDTPIIFLDFHAEATSEKQAMLHHLDGKVTAVFGTHTHVQTADEHVTENGTAYISDAGMTGPHDSIIGMLKEPSLGRFLTGMPKRFSVASEDVKLSGVLVEVEPTTGKAESIERVKIDFDPRQANIKNGEEPD